MRLLVATVLILFAGMLPATAAPGTSGSRPVVAIIIDDLGHRMPIAQRVIAFPVPVACAVLPDTPHAGRIAAAIVDRVETHPGCTRKHWDQLDVVLVGWRRRRRCRRLCEAG